MECNGVMAGWFLSVPPVQLGIIFREWEILRVVAGLYALLFLLQLIIIVVQLLVRPAVCQSPPVLHSFPFLVCSSSCDV